MEFRRLPIPAPLRRGVSRLATRTPDPAAVLRDLRDRIPEGPVVPPSPPQVQQLPPEDDDAPVVRARWPHVVTVSVAAGGLVLALAGVKAVNEIAAPLFLALNLVIAGYPLHGWLRRHGVPAVLAATITGGFLITLLVGFFALIGWSIAALVLELPHYVPKMERLYLDVLGMLETRGITEQQIIDGLTDTVSTQWQNLAEQGLTLLQGILSNVGGVLSLLAVIMMLLLFLSMDTIGIGHRFELIRDTNPHAAAVLQDFARGVRRYWVVTTVFGLIVAVLDVGVLLALGIPLALVWGVLSFLTNYIPNVGIVLGLLPPALLALLDKGPGAALTVVVAYCVLNFVIQTLIQPKVTGDAVGVTPTVSVISLMFWTWILGPLGALLALPATLLLKALLVDGDRDAGWVSYLITSNPVDQRGPGATRLPAPMPDDAPAAGDTGTGDAPGTSHA